jgi:DNA-directed RNA polymerase specialized sigma24 family protein
MKYTYYFADGTTSTVEVDKYLSEFLEEQDKRERHENHTQATVRICLKRLAEKKNDERYSDELFYGITYEKVHTVLTKLIPSQQDLLYRVFVEGATVDEIAEEDGIAVLTVRRKLERIYKKLGYFLQDGITL